MNKGCFEEGLSAPVNKEAIAEGPLKLEVLNPSGAFEVKYLPTSRTPDLKGKTICLQWQGGWRGDVIFPYLQQALTRRIPDAKVLAYTDLPVKHPDQMGEKAFVKAVKDRGCDAVILGNAG